MLGSKLVMGQRNSIFSLKKTRQRRQHFPQQSQTTGAPARQVDVLTLLLLNDDIKKTQSIKNANFLRLLIVKMFTRSGIRSYLNGAQFDSFKMN